MRSCTRLWILALAIATMVACEEDDPAGDSTDTVTADATADGVADVPEDTISEDTTPSDVSVEACAAVDQRCEGEQPEGWRCVRGRCRAECDGGSCDEGALCRDIEGASICEPLCEPFTEGACVDGLACAPSADGSEPWWCQAPGATPEGGDCGDFGQSSCVAGALCILDFANLDGNQCQVACDRETGAGCDGVQICAQAWRESSSGLLVPLDFGQCLDACGYNHGEPESPNPACPEGKTCYPGELFGADDDVCADDHLVERAVGEACTLREQGAFCGPNRLCGAASEATCDALCFSSEGAFGVAHPDCPSGTVCTDLGFSSEGYGVCL